MKSLLNKNVIITGAAAGIGRLMALDFAREKANLVILDINAKLLSETEKELLARKVRVKSYVCDISNKKDVDQVAKAIKKDIGFIDVLVNNAGIVSGKAFLDLSYEEIKRTIDVNFMGMVMMTRHFLPDMAAKNCGHIVNIASSAGLQGMPKMSDYCASKFASVGFTDAVRMESKKYGYGGVKFTCVCPYIIETGMFKGFTPMLLNRPLQPDYVSRKVIEGVKKDKPYVKMPFMVSLVPWTKLLPTAVSDWLLKVFGADKAMDHFTGLK